MRLTGVGWVVFLLRVVKLRFLLWMHSAESLPGARMSEMVAHPPSLSPVAPRHSISQPELLYILAARFQEGIF